MCRNRQPKCHTEIGDGDSKKKEKKQEVASKRGADHFRPACGVIPRRGSPPAESVIPSLHKTENREKFQTRTKCWLQCLFEIRGSKILLDYLADFTERQADTEGGFCSGNIAHSDLLTGVAFVRVDFEPEQNQGREKKKWESSRHKACALT